MGAPGNCLLPPPPPPPQAAGSWGGECSLGGEQLHARPRPQRASKVGARPCPGCLGRATSSNPGALATDTPAQLTAETRRNGR